MNYNISWSNKKKISFIYVLILSQQSKKLRVSSLTVTHFHRLNHNPIIIYVQIRNGKNLSPI